MAKEKINIWQARKDIVKYSHLVQEYRFVSATDGNLSIRLDENRILITPSGLAKRDMTIDAPVVIDREGTVVEGERRVSTEAKLHLEIYAQRDDVQAVVHAHPPKCIAFTIAGVKLPTCVLPEVVVSLGDVPVSEYATPSTDAVPHSIRELIKQSDAIILDRHGTVTVGADLDSAFKKLEKLEHTAEIALYAHIMGNVRSLPKDELERLQELRSYYGVTTQQVSCSIDGGCAAPADKSVENITKPEKKDNVIPLPGADNPEKLVDYIVEQVKKRL